MPYEIKKVKGKYVVKKKNGKRIFGRHDTRKDALRQLRAIEANED